MTIKFSLPFLKKETPAYVTGTPRECPTLHVGGMCVSTVTRTPFGSKMGWEKGRRDSCGKSVTRCVYVALKAYVVRKDVFCSYVAVSIHLTSLLLEIEISWWRVTGRGLASTG